MTYTDEEILRHSVRHLQRRLQPNTAADVRRLIAEIPDGLIDVAADEVQSRVVQLSQRNEQRWLEALEREEQEDREPWLNSSLSKREAILLELSKTWPAHEESAEAARTGAMQLIERLLRSPFSVWRSNRSGKGRHE